MKLGVNFEKTKMKFNLAASRPFISLLLSLVLASCAAGGAKEAELAAQQARAAIEEQAAASKAAQEQEQARAAALQAQRQQQAAERSRLQAMRVQAEAEAEAQARTDEAQRQLRVEVERRERARLAAIAAEAEVERQQRLDRIGELEQQIAAVRTDISDDEADIELLQEAIAVAEELLDVLAVEQAKYDDTDDQGKPLQPLAKDLIADIEARKDALLSQVNAQ